jgi:Tat protein translocase TatB subunit
MFDLSIGEIALIAVVALVFIGPKELPVVMRAISRGLKQLKGMAWELRRAFDDMAKDSGVKEMVDEFEGDVRMIKGDDGKWYESYGLEKTATRTKPEQDGP